jgi:hypothetical protein
MSRRDFPSNLFREVVPSNRNRLGIHNNLEVRDLESRCQGALWDLIKCSKAHTNRAVLQIVESELNRCQQELMQMPKRWRQAFWAKRSHWEQRLNDIYGTRGIRLNLPWGQLEEDWGTPGARGHNGEFRGGRQMAAAGAGGSATRRAGAAALARQHAGQAAVGSSYSSGQMGFGFQSARGGGPATAQTTSGAQSGGSSFNITGHVSSTPVNLGLRIPQGLGRGRGKPAPTQAVPTQSSRVTFEDLSDRAQGRLERESVNRDTARFGDIVNAFKVDEDPLSRPLQRREAVITLVDDGDNVLYGFHLIHGRNDSYTQDLVRMVEAKMQTDRESQTGRDRSLDIAMNAIQEGVVEQIASSARAGGDIWATREDRMAIARVLLDISGNDVGKWTLFGIGVGISKGRLFLLQRFGDS